MELTQEYLKNSFDYSDGNLLWKVSHGNRAKLGEVAGSIAGNGYLYTSLNKTRCSIHRLIFMWHYGYMPKVVDHIDGNPLNNKVENLRGCTHQQNILNQKIKSTNTSGCKSVMWSKEKNKWYVQLRVNGFKKNFGYFEDLELADLVAQEARDKFHGKYARHN